MTVAIVVPLATENADRLAVWEYVEARYHTEHPEWQIVTGTCDPPFCKALAAQDALSKTDAGTLIVADADVWCADLHLVDRVAGDTFEWAMPHRQVYRLNEPATTLVLGGADLHETASSRGMLAQPPYDGMVGGGIVIIARDLYERVPFDPLFQGWGGEDESWGRALKTLAPRHTQGASRLWHLHHVPAERMNRRMGNVENRKRTEQYIAALGDRDAMTVLIEEARCLLTSSSETA